MTGEDEAAVADNTDSRLAQLSIAEQTCGPSRSAEDGYANGQLQQNGGRPSAAAAAQSAPEPDTGRARRPPLHLVNARRRPSQGGCGRNIVNVYTRDGEEPSAGAAVSDASCQCMCLRAHVAARVARRAPQCKTRHNTREDESQSVLLLRQLH